MYATDLAACSSALLRTYPFLRNATADVPDQTVGAGLPAMVVNDDAHCLSDGVVQIFLHLQGITRLSGRLRWQASSYSLIGVHLQEIARLSGRLRWQASSYSLIGVHLQGITRLSGRLRWQASSYSLIGVHLQEIAWLSGRLRWQASSYSLIGVHLQEIAWLAGRLGLFRQIQSHKATASAPATPSATAGQPRWPALRRADWHTHG